MSWYGFQDQRLRFLELEATAGFVVLVTTRSSKPRILTRELPAPALTLFKPVKLFISERTAMASAKIRKHKPVLLLFIVIPTQSHRENSGAQSCKRHAPAVGGSKYGMLVAQSQSLLVKSETGGVIG